MHDFWKVASTAVIWGAVAIILTFGDYVPSDMVWITLILGFAAAISMRYIWRPAAVALEQQSTKAKRDARMSRLVDRLDDDQVYQLEELLAARREEPYTERQS